MQVSMNKLLDKLVIFLFCFALYIFNRSDVYIIVPVIIAITCSALNNIFEDRCFRITSLSLYIIICLYLPNLVFFLPLIAYDMLWSKQPLFVLLTAIPIAVNYDRFSSVIFFWILFFFALAWLIQYRSLNLDKIRHEYIELRDNAQEFSLHFEEKNRELLERQDYAINLATLQERNRIAREIHDNIGHLLSSSILQIGALIATCQDDASRENLQILKNTLSQGMDTLRDSIHDLHDESYDLYSETNTLIDGFRFCPVSLDYDIQDNPDIKVKYAFMAIMKEALANIMKHSNASQVHITLREHPALYQLIVRDNGSQTAINQTGGIGLNNIADRVNSLGGKMNINNSNGFLLFISIPREGSHEHRNCG